MSLTIAIGIVVGFVVKEIASGALKETGKEFLFQPIKNILKPEELTTLNLFDEFPQSKELEGKVINILQTRLSENPEVTNQLTELIKQIQQSSKTNINVQSGNESKSYQDMNFKGGNQHFGDVIHNHGDSGKK